jgi:hypothetical protein
MGADEVLLGRHGQLIQRREVSLGEMRRVAGDRPTGVHHCRLLAVH